MNLRILDTAHPWIFALLTMAVVLLLCVLFGDESDRRGL